MPTSMEVDYQQAIAIEPILRDSQDQKKYDRRGEEILLEGKCYKLGVCNSVFLSLMPAAVLSIVGMLLLIPVGVICYYKKVSHWRLYLTHESVFYHHDHTPCGCAGREWEIPLRYINELYVAPGTLDIHLYMEPSKMREYLSMSSCCCLGGPPSCELRDCLVLSNVANGEEFVEAVIAEQACSEELLYTVMVDV